MCGDARVSTSKHALFRLHALVWGWRKVQEYGGSTEDVSDGVDSDGNESWGWERGGRWRGHERVAPGERKA